MAKRTDTRKHAKIGKFVVQSKGKTAGGALVWRIRDTERSTEKKVITSPSSAAAIRSIEKTHTKALERLAKK